MGAAAAIAARTRVAIGVAVLTVLATLLGGVVAAAVAGSYGVVAGLALARRERDRAGAKRRAALVEAIGNAAADLRAGLAADTALAGVTGPGGAADGAPATDRADPTVDQLAAQVRAGVRLAERTGAPLADLLERIEADVRAGDRARSAATAQAAGSRATAWLLAALPAGGLAIGYAIGADPLAVLLHTPAGAGCALGAVALQLGGLAWTQRIARPSSAVRP